LANQGLWEDTCLRFNKDTRQIDLLLGTDLKDQVISKLSPSFVSSAVDVWSKYVLSDVSLMEIASLANKWKDAHIEADVLSGDSFISRVFDLGVPVSVYQWMRIGLRAGI